MLTEIAKYGHDIIKARIEKRSDDPPSRHNILVDKCQRATDALIAMGEDGIAALADLWTHEHPEVRSYAAAYLLPYRTQEATAVLESLIEHEVSARSEAELSLKLWEKKQLRLLDDNILAGSSPDTDGETLDAAEMSSRYRQLAVRSRCGNAHEAVTAYHALTTLYLRMMHTEEGRQQVVRLLHDDDDARVRCWAAVHLLDWEVPDAYTTLQALAQTSTDLAYDVETAVMLQEQGLLYFETSDAIARRASSPAQPVGYDTLHEVSADDMAALLASCDLQQYAAEIRALLRTSIVCRATPCDEDQLPIGRSKLGGLPDLPAEYGWPRYQNVPMQFIAQIYLPEITAFDREGALTDSGMLYLFFDPFHEAYGDKWSERGSTRVIYAPESSLAHLTRHPLPLGLSAEAVITACSIACASSVSLPTTAVAARDLPLAPEDEEKYADLLERLNRLQFGQDYDEGRALKLLGYPDFGYDPFGETVAYIAGRDQASISEGEPSAHDFADYIGQMQMLAQLCTAEELNMEWSGCSYQAFLYIGTPLHTARRFCDAWGILYNT